MPDLLLKVLALPERKFRGNRLDHVDAFIVVVAAVLAAEGREIVSCVAHRCLVLAALLVGRCFCRNAVLRGRRHVGKVQSQRLGKIDCDVGALGAQVIVCVPRWLRLVADVELGKRSCERCCDGVVADGFGHRGKFARGDMEELVVCSGEGFAASATPRRREDAETETDLKAQQLL